MQGVFRVWLPCKSLQIGLIASQVSVSVLAINSVQRIFRLWHSAIWRRLVWQAEILKKLIHVVMSFAAVFAGPFFLVMTLTISFNGYNSLFMILSMNSSHKLDFSEINSGLKWPLLEWKRTLRKLISFRSLFVLLCKVLLLFELFKCKWVLFSLVKCDYFSAAE